MRTPARHSLKHNVGSRLRASAVIGVGIVAAVMSGLAAGPMPSPRSRPGNMEHAGHPSHVRQAGDARRTAPWVPASGDGTYRNPIIFADYSDPDVVRAGDDFYLVSSSFQNVPGIPVLHSRDLVNWRIIGHAIAELSKPRYDSPQYGNGVWAPSVRYHAGLFWVFFGDPDLGIFMTTAKDPRGPWAPLALVREARGWIDPCPLWDDDGQAYLVHAWANSRAGFNSVMTVNRMTADGRRLLDDGVTVFDGHANHPTIEGPKFYKRHGYYYIFAPAGGVKTGWQTVLRSRAVTGPYEDRIVLGQGTTDVNGPHQGGWVETPDGASWFVHFQDREAYGRVVHLQPMSWRNDWPVIGREVGTSGRGEPVLTWTVPKTSAVQAVVVPQTSDEFETPSLGLQWQWNANPSAAWSSLTARPGSLRLYAQPANAGAPNLWPVSSLLFQKFPAPVFEATTRLSVSALGPGERAGLLVMGIDYALIAVTRSGTGLTVGTAVCLGANKGAAETAAPPVAIPATDAVVLKVTIGANAICRFAYSTDGSTFVKAGAPFTARAGQWIGARVGVFAGGPATSGSGGFVDAEWFRIQ